MKFLRVMLAAALCAAALAGCGSSEKGRQRLYHR